MSKSMEGYQHEDCTCPGCYQDKPWDEYLKQIEAEKEIAAA